MAAGAWTVYNKAKKKIGNTTINLAATTFRIALFQSAATSPASLSTLSLLSQISNQVAEGNGYSSSGKALTSEVWTAGASDSQYKFDVSDVVWTGTGGSIANIKYAVIFLSAASAGGCHVLCYSQLTSTPFTLASGNTLTIQMNASGVLTLA
jgi:hypothetical protein